MKLNMNFNESYEYKESVEKKEEGFFKNIWNKIVELFRKFWNWVKSFFKKNNLKDEISKARKDLKEEKIKIYKVLSEKEKEYENKKYELEDRKKDLDKREEKISEHERSLEYKEKEIKMLKYDLKSDESKLKRRIDDVMKIEVTKMASVYSSKLNDIQKNILNNIKSVNGKNVKGNSWLYEIIDDAHIAKLKGGNALIIDRTRFKKNIGFDIDKVITIYDLNEIMKHPDVMTAHIYGNNKFKTIFCKNDIRIEVSDIPVESEINERLNYMKNGFNKIFNSLHKSLSKGDKEVSRIKTDKERLIYADNVEFIREFGDIMKNTLIFHRELFMALHGACKSVTIKLRDGIDYERIASGIYNMQ